MGMAWDLTSPRVSDIREESKRESKSFGSRMPSLLPYAIGLIDQLSYNVEGDYEGYE